MIPTGSLLEISMPPDEDIDEQLNALALAYLRSSAARAGRTMPRHLARKENREELLAVGRLSIDKLQKQNPAYVANVMQCRLDLANGLTEREARRQGRYSKCVVDEAICPRR